MNEFYWRDHCLQNLRDVRAATAAIHNPREANAVRRIVLAMHQHDLLTVEEVYLAGCAMSYRLAEIAHEKK